MKHIHKVKLQEIAHIEHIVQEATEPVTISIRCKNTSLIISSQIAILIQSANHHLEKFNEKLKIVDLNDYQIKIFDALKLSALWEYSV